MTDVLIVDDEKLAIQRLEIKLAQHKDITISGACRDGDAAIQALQTKKPDLVFLDISMPGADGLTVAETAADLGVHVIFVTAFMQYAVPAFEAQAVDYLLKPVSSQRLERALDRYRDQKATAHAMSDIAELKSIIAQLRAYETDPKHKVAAKTIWIKDKGRHQKIETDKIEWVEAARDYVSLHMIGGQHYFVRKSMRNVEKELGETLFQRVHRSAIVNLSYIIKKETLDGAQSLHMQSGAKIRIGRKYKPVTNLRLKEVMTG